MSGSSVHIPVRNNIILACLSYFGLYCLCSKIIGIIWYSCYFHWRMQPDKMLWHRQHMDIWVYHWTHTYIALKGEKTAINSEIQKVQYFSIYCPPNLELKAKIFKFGDEIVSGMENNKKVTLLIQNHLNFLFPPSGLNINTNCQTKDRKSG